MMKNVVWVSNNIFRYLMEGGANMSGLVFLLIGLILGGCVGTAFIAILQINRINDYEREIERLKQKQRNML